MRSVLFSCSLLFLFGCGLAAAIHNNSAIDDIQVGDSYEFVTDKLVVKKDESFSELGHRFDVVTARVTGPAEKSRKPFIFMDGALVGFGHDFYSRFKRARNDPSVFGKMIDQMMMAPPNNSEPQKETPPPGQGV